MEPHNPLLDRYLLSLSESEEPKICFIGTASFDDEGYRNKFYKCFEGMPCKTSHLAIGDFPNGQSSESLESFVNQQNIFYVGGGNTVNLLSKWRESGLDVLLRKAYERGVIMAGLSAGSICWFEEGLSDSVNPGSYERLECLSWLKGSHCPHFDGEAKRQERYKKFVIEGTLKGGWAADDGCALHFVNEEIFRIVASHPDKKAFRFSSSVDHPNQQGIEAGYLGGGSVLIRPTSEEELHELLKTHGDSLALLVGKGNAQNHAFVFEVYGQAKAYAVIAFPEEGRVEADGAPSAGELKFFWNESSLDGHPSIERFRTVVTSMGQKDFC